VFFGAMPTQMIPGLYQSRLDTWAEWKDVSIDADGH
jgi:hypothetical protein